MNRFVFEGGFRLFDVKVGTLELTVTRSLMSATVTLSEEITQHLLGIMPGPISIYWNDEGFHTNLQIPGLMFENFRFTNVQSREICQKLGGYIGELAIDAPFHLNNSIIAREIDNETIFFGVVFSGYAGLQIIGEPILTVPITPKYIGVRLHKGEALSWSVFLQIIEQGLLSAGQQIVGDLLDDSRAITLMAAGRLGQLVVSELAQAACQALLDSPPPPPDPLEPFDPADIPEIPASAAAGSVPLSGIPIVATGGASATCLILKIFGGCGSSSNDRNEDMISELQEMLMQTCSSGLCDQGCEEINDMIHCSCNDGYYLGADQHSCIRELGFNYSTQNSVYDFTKFHVSCTLNVQDSYNIKDILGGLEK